MTTVTVTCPDGHAISGTLEQLSGVAEISRFASGPAGLVSEHNGTTEIDYNSQVSEIDERGQTLFVCEQGDIYATDRLVVTPTSA